MAIRSDAKALKAGDVDVREIILVMDSGPSIDLSRNWAQISIFENLFSNTLSGSILLNDELNLPGNLPIVGNEKIRIRFITPGRKTSIECEFQVYGIDERDSVKESLQQYLIKFVSYEHVLDVTRRISKSYTGKISTIIPTLFRDGLSYKKQSYAKDQSSIREIEETENSQKLIVPNLHPFEAINWISSMAFRKGRDNRSTVASYLFFQNVDGFRFVSADTLVSRPTVASYTSSISNIREKDGAVDIEREFYNASDVRTIVSMDKMAQVASGMFGSTLLSFDPISKSFRKNSLSYRESFEGQNHLERNPLTTTSQDLFGVDLNFERQGSFFSTCYSPAVFDIYLPNYKSSYLLQRRSQVQQLESNRVQLVVPGDTDRRVGECVELSIPSAEQQSTKEKMDPMLSGRYLIRSIHHKITRTRYDLHMEICKDSFATPIPDRTTIQ